MSRTSPSSGTSLTGGRRDEQPGSVVGSAPSGSRVGGRVARGRALAGGPTAAGATGRRLAAEIRRAALHVPLRVPALEGHLRRGARAGVAGGRRAGAAGHLERGHRRLPAPQLGRGRSHLLRRHLPRGGDRADRAHVRPQRSGLHLAAERRPAFRDRRPVREHRLSVPPRRDPRRPARTGVGHRGRGRAAPGGHRALQRTARRTRPGDTVMGRPDGARGDRLHLGHHLGPQRGHPQRRHPDGRNRPPDHHAWRRRPG